MYGREGESGWASTASTGTLGSSNDPRPILWLAEEAARKTESPSKQA